MHPSAELALLPPTQRTELSAVAMPSDRFLRDEMMRSLVWVAEAGMGFSGNAVRAPSVYDDRYWQKYQAYEGSPIAVALNKHRVALVNRVVGLDVVLDIGIGCGTFITARGPAVTKGYDVNPLGIAWLKERGLWVDPYEQPVTDVTFWDALEHIHDPAMLLANVRRYAFVSL